MPARFAKFSFQYEGLLLLNYQNKTLISARASCLWDPAAGDAPRESLSAKTHSAGAGAEMSRELREGDSKGNAVKLRADICCAQANACGDTGGRKREAARATSGS